MVTDNVRIHWNGTACLVPAGECMEDWGEDEEDKEDEDE